MKLTEREFVKVARVKMLDGLVDLCDHGTGLPAEIEEILTAKLANTLKRVRRDLFGNNKEKDIHRSDIILALAEASADSDKEYHFIESFDDISPLMETAVLLMESKIAASITKELFKEENNGNN
jgi:hypothetical protein